MTLKTEAEAKKTWCPEGRAVGPFFTPDHPINRRQLVGIATSNRGDASTNCIGAQCMAWRFVDHIDLHPRRGYCGKYSKPEIEE